MSKRTESSIVLCPFYHSEDKQKIFCEGIENGTAVHLAFDNQSHAKEYRAFYCCSKYKSCLINQMQERRYDEEL